MHVSNRLRCVASLTFFLTLLFGFAGMLAQAEETASVDIVEGAEWYYFKGTKEPAMKWNHVGFERSQEVWHKGRTGVGYGHERVRTELGDMKGKYSDIYASRYLVLSNADYELLQLDSAEVTLSIACDGAFKA